MTVSTDYRTKVLTFKDVCAKLGTGGDKHEVSSSIARKAGF